VHGFYRCAPSQSQDTEKYAAQLASNAVSQVETPSRFPLLPSGQSVFSSRRARPKSKKESKYALQDTKKEGGDRSAAEVVGKPEGRSQEGWKGLGGVTMEQTSWLIVYRPPRWLRLPSLRHHRVGCRIGRLPGVQ
jgi:hypothetical protein